MKIFNRRFLSIFYFSIFYFFMIININPICKCYETKLSSVKKYVAMNISDKFNANAIFDPEKNDWYTNFDNDLTSAKQKYSWADWNLDSTMNGYKIYSHGVDGYAAYTFKKENGENELRNGNSIPRGGKVTIPFKNGPSEQDGGIPFHVVEKPDGKDCIRLGKYTNESSYDDPKNLTIFNENEVEVDLPEKTKDVYIMGVVSGEAIEGEVGGWNNVPSPTNFTYKVTYENGNSNVLNSRLYNYFADAQNVLDTDPNIVGYSSFGVRTCSQRNDLDSTHIHCLKVPIPEGIAGSGRATKLTINYDAYSRGQFMVIFGMTAEVKFENEIKLVNNSINSFDVRYTDSGFCYNGTSKARGGAYNEEFSNLNGHTINNQVYDYSYTFSDLNLDSKYHYTLYDSNSENLYYYFTVETKKTMSLDVNHASNLVYNGRAQQLVDSATLYDKDNNIISDDNIRRNIYLIVKDSAGHNVTNWCCLNDLSNLKATNAGIYHIYYYFDEDTIIDYKLISVKNSPRNYSSISP